MLQNLKHVWYIALNDLRLFMTDRLAVGMFILFPFLFIVMFNLMLGNIGGAIEKYEVVAKGAQGKQRGGAEEHHTDEEKNQPLVLRLHWVWIVRRRGFFGLFSASVCSGASWPA